MRRRASKSRTSKKIPFSRADISREDIRVVSEVLRSGWLTHGRHAEAFEAAFARFTGARHAIAVSTCTAGLHLSCLAAGLGPGDEVIVPAQTHVASAHAVEMVGARPVFADVELWTGNLLPSEIPRLRTARTRAVLVVHMAGFPCRMREIRRLAREHDLRIIEDCAHALGTTISGRHVGTFGTAGCFSFYPTKQIATGEGGMVITDADSTAEFIRVHRAFGISTPPVMRVKPGHYDVVGLGNNYRMTDFQAALGVRQLRRYPRNLRMRRRKARLYHAAFQRRGPDWALPEFDETASYFLFQAFARDREHRDRALASLKRKNIGCSVHYARPVPAMTYYREKYGLDPSGAPQAFRYGERNISLPVHPFLRNDDIPFIVEELVGA